MPEVNSREPVYLPAVFPLEGRLPRDVKIVRANYQKQLAEERAYRQQLNAARGGPGAFTCAHSLHISLLFDGTNNNESVQVPQESRLARTAFLRNSIITTREWL